ncbi:hypothetical protein QZH41_009851, partial [Actinostola sp. cb2023]
MNVFANRCTCTFAQLISFLFQTVLAKALYDNIADNEDELTFRKGDVITVLEKDIDGLYGWWLCSLHGRQGIAPGNRLTEIPKEKEPVKTPPTFEELDYAVPRPFEENGEDYDVPRSVFSPQDYDFPKPREPKFEYPPEPEKVVSLPDPPPMDATVDNIYQEIYDVPTVTPEKRKPEPLLMPEKRIPPQRPPSPQKVPQLLTKSAPKTKPPRKINLEKDGSLKPTQIPPPRPPMPTSPRTPKLEKKFPPPQEVYDVPAAIKAPVAHTNSVPGSQSNGITVTSQVKTRAGSSTSLESDSMSHDRTDSSNSSGGTPREDMYVLPAESTGEELYDVPPSIRSLQDGLQDQDGEIYDVPKFPVPSIETAPSDPQDTQSEPTIVKALTNIWEKNRLSDESSKSSSGVSEVGVASRGSGGSDLSGSRPGSDASDKGGSKRGSSGSGASSERSGSGTSDGGVAKRGSGGSGGKRESNSSTGSGKVSSEDDDYVDYQEIYGFGKAKPVNVYDVPVQPMPVPEGNVAPPTKKQTKVSILQRINMSAVKEIKLDPPAALQRLTKLEQAVDVTVAKLLSYVTSTWRDPTLLRSNVADIRDIAGKAKVVLRLLTEFGLSTLVNAQKLPQQDMMGILSRAIEPLLETYYSLKLTLQRLDDTDWKAPLSERKQKDHDDLDLIMAYMQSVPQGSKKLATVIRTAATALYKLPKEPLAPPLEPKQKQPKPVEEEPLPVDQTSKAESTSGETKKVVEVSSKIERFKPVAMEAESAEVNSTTMMVGLIKACVDANIKPGDGPKFSPETVRRLCGLSSSSSSSLKDMQRDTAADTGTPKLPPRRSDSINKESVANKGPIPPSRKDSGERVHHVRQKSLERFAPDGEGTPKTKVPPNPPPKPKLDRKPTIRKSYKYRVREDKADDAELQVKFRERLPGFESPKEGKRKCNSDPTELERVAGDGNNNRKDKRVSDHLETTVPGNAMVSKSILSPPSHCSDSALPSTPTGQRWVTPLSPKLNEFQGNPRPDIRIQRSKSFTRTKPPAPKTPFGENG